MIPDTDDPNAQWPPSWMEPILHRIETWAAWHSGDPEKLAAVYSGSDDSTGFFASEQGGFKARVRRWVSNIVRYFWGQRSNQPRRRLHDPIAGDIASASADLLFAEPISVKVTQEGTDDTHEDGQEFIDGIMDEGAHATLLEGGETAAALSGAYLRARWDTDNIGKTHWFDIIGPDCAVPVWRNGRLDACTLWKIVGRKNRTVFRHLEHHRRGEIEHALHAGDEDTLGPRVALDTLPDLAGLAEVADADGVIATGTDRLTVEYAPNMRPNRIWRDVPKAVHLGVSDFSGIEGLLDANDLAYSSLMRDVDLGKARLVVPKSYLTDHGRGQGASLDIDREVYETVNAMADEDKGMQLEMVQFDIRVEDHERVLLRLKTDAVTRAGYSAQTFGLTGDVAMTATEVAAKERRSLTTRSRKMQYWAPALRGILTTLLEIAGHSGVEVKLEWPAAVGVDPEAEARTVKEWSDAAAASTETKVRKLHPEWDDDQVSDEVDRILEENQIGQAEDPGEFTGRFDQDETTEDQPEELEAAV